MPKPESVDQQFLAGMHIDIDVELIAEIDEIVDGEYDEPMGAESASKDRPSTFTYDGLKQHDTRPPVAPPFAG